jgi:hypothetical protein
MGISALLALAMQGIGTAGGAIAQGVGLGATASGAGTGLAGGITTATSQAATALGAGASGTGVLGTGVTAAEIGTGLTTAGTALASMPASKPTLQKRSKEIETGVGEETEFRGKKRRTVASTVQSGGMKRNTLG